MQRSLFFRFFRLASAASLFATAAAQPIPDTLTSSRPPIQLHEVTVLGNLQNRDVARSSVVVTPVTIQRTVATDSWDLLRQTAGLEVHEQGQGPGFASDASIRGFSSDHSTDIALWIDGVPVNEPVNGHAEGYNDFSLLFPLLIRNIEVVKGPASPLYGNFAIAGAINVLTLDRTEATTASLTRGPNGHTEGDLVTGFDKGTSGGVFGIRGIDDGGWRPNGAWQLGQIYGRFVQDVGSDAAVDAGIGLYSSGWHSPGFLTADQFARGMYDTSTSDTDRGFKQRAQERISARVFLAPDMLWRSTVYSTQGRWQLFLTIPPEPGEGEGSGSQTEEEDRRYGFGATSAISYSEPWGDLTVGVEGRYDHADYQRWFTTNRMRDSADAIAAARQSSGSVMAELNVKLAERLRLSAGVRFDALGTVSDQPGIGTLSGGNSTLSPKLGISWRVSPNANLYGNVSRGFRQTDGVILDPTLPFILAWNEEVGVKWGDEFLSADVALFQMNVSNEQTFDPVTLTTTSGGESRRRGIDISARLLATNAATLSGTWTITDATYRKLITDDGDDLSGAPIFNTSKYVGTLDAEYAPPDAIWELGIRANFVGPYTPFDETGVTLPAYEVFSASASVRIGKATVQLGVRNLFDVAYAELRAGGYVDPGQPRGVYGTVRYEF